MYRILIILSILLFAITSDSTAQKSTTKKITKVMKRIVEFNARYPQEKVYLHFDNTCYFNGETIWYAAYCVRADNNTLTDISRVLYVELLTPDGEIVETQKVLLTDGRGNGCFHLNTLLNSGFYEIRAYTSYMLNWLHTDIFSQIIPVFNKPKTKGDYGEPEINQVSHKNRLPNYRQINNQTNKKDSITVKFYPEGGDLIKGIKSKVAYIVHCNGEERERGVTEYTPAGNGTKDFEYNGKKYPFPEAKADGCVVRVDTDDDYAYKATFTASDLHRGEIFAYILMNGGMIHYADTFTANPTSVRTVVRDDLPDGINRLIVYNAEGRIFCDRLIFKCPETDSANIVHVTSLKKSPSPYEKIRTEVKASPNTYLSFAVTDSATSINGRNTNIKSYMLLTSEIKGYIHNPNYYFEADDIEHRKAADLLMLTQGWRRYEWNAMTSDSLLTLAHPSEDRLYLRGKLTSLKRESKVSYIGLKAFLWNEKGASASGKTSTKKDGSFIWAMPGFWGDYNLQIIAKNEKLNDDFIVSIDRDISPEPRPFYPKETERIPKTYDNSLFKPNMSEVNSVDDTLDMTSRNHLLEEVSIESKKKWNPWGNKETNTWYDESPGMYHSTLIYNCSNEVEKIIDRGETVPTLYQWLSTKNSFFASAEPMTPYFPYNPNQPLVDEGEVENEFWQTNTSKSPNLYRDGFSYKNRMIVWILNNKYAGITNMKHFFKLIPLNDIGTDKVLLSSLKESARVEYRNFEVIESTIEQMPFMLDEVKSVYISESPMASRRFINCDDAQFNNAVTIFVYTYPYTNNNSESCLRRTHFQGYNVPETFEMEDYSIMPPMEDFRRTLYWNPNVKTDKDGKATIEFYNNSSCTQMFISAEGITKDGKFIISGD